MIYSKIDNVVVQTFSLCYKKERLHYEKPNFLL